MAEDTEYEGIFVPELDDDATRILGRDTGKIALLTYLMLGKYAVIHPAYDWQNPKARELTLGDLDFLKGEDVRIILGNSEATDEYIFDRIDKLEQAVSLTKMDINELKQYLRFTPEQIKKDCDIFDELLVSEGKVHDINWSRDERFRQLVREELKLVKYIRYGQHLGALLFDKASHLSHSERHGLIDRLIDFTEDKAKLLSCDSIVAELSKSDYTQSAIEKIDARLHVLHWKAHEGTGLIVPLVSRLDRGVIHPFDPEVFWGITNVIVGEKTTDELLSLPWSEQFRLVRELKSVDEWTNYLSVYHLAVDELSAGCKDLDPEKVKKQICEVYEGTGKAVLSAIPKWQTAILIAWLSAVGTGVGGLFVPGIIGIAMKISGIVSLGGVVNPVKPTKKILEAIKTAVRESAYCDRTELKNALRKCLDAMKIRKAATS
jgi:hypothetical protein